MKRIHLYSLLLVCLYVVGCHKSEPASEPQEFVATLETLVTKAIIADGGKVSWEKTDVIALYDAGKPAPIMASVKSISADGRMAIFTPASEIANPVGAIYPYDANAVSSNNVVSLPLKASQRGTFSDAEIAASKAEGYLLSFRNVTSFFKFRIIDEYVKSVKLSAAGLAGTLNITLGDPGSSALSGTSTADVITVSDIKPDTDYYMVVAPGTYESVQFSWYDNAGTELGSSSLGEDVKFEAGTIYDLEELTAPQPMGDEYVQFEDENFKAYCVNNFDTDQDGEISAEEAWYVTDMYVDPATVASLGGIECFPNLMYLDCSLPSSSTATPKLTSLDLSGNTALWYLLCAGIQLTSLDLSNNTDLLRLSCERNQLTALDLSNNAKLKDLDCGRNQLASLDVSKNANLNQLFCSDNKLISLTVSNNAKLAALWCERNQLTSLDVSGCAELTSLNCTENKLTTLDVSNNTELMGLYCTNNQISYIYVWEGFDESDYSDWYKDPSTQYVVK